MLFQTHRWASWRQGLCLAYCRVSRPQKKWVEGDEMMGGLLLTVIYDCYQGRQKIPVSSWHQEQDQDIALFWSQLHCLRQKAQEIASVGSPTNQATQINSTFAPRMGTGSGLVIQQQRPKTSKTSHNWTESSQGMESKAELSHPEQWLAPLLWGDSSTLWTLRAGLFKWRFQQEERGAPPTPEAAQPTACSKTHPTVMSPKDTPKFHFMTATPSKGFLSSSFRFWSSLKCT